MSKVYLFAVMLLAASLTGCIEGGEELEKSTTPTEEENEEEEKEEETLKPVGEDNMSSLKKRVSDLEAIIAEYELPKVYFMEFKRNDSFSGGLADYYGPNLADDGSLMCYLYNQQKVCYLYAMMYDVNGIITSYSLEGSESDVEMNCLTIVNSDPAECYAYATQAITFEVCQLENLNQTLTLTVYDNDGNEASASYELDYFTNCGRTYDPNYDPDRIPEISFFVQEGSDGIYHVDIISITESYPIEEYSFFLKDTSGSTYLGGNGFGEIAMQIIDGQEHGIDTSYEDKGGTDQQLIDRGANITNDDGAVYPVHFHDNDRDGTLSAGDRFMVHGSGNTTYGPATDNWRLDIHFDISGDIVGSAVMM